MKLNSSGAFLVNSGATFSGDVEDTGDGALCDILVGDSNANASLPRASSFSGVCDGVGSATGLFERTLPLVAVALDRIEHALRLTSNPARSYTLGKSGAKDGNA